MGTGILDEGFVKLVKGKIRQGIIAVFKINGYFITRFMGQRFLIRFISDRFFSDLG
jgi:hypothetical protein